MISAHNIREAITRLYFTDTYIFFFAMIQFMTVIKESETPSISMQIKTANRSLHRPIPGPEVSRMLRFPDFKTFDTCRW
jgi:hypothetical protein